MITNEGHVDHLAGADGDFGDDFSCSGCDWLGEGYDIVLLRDTWQTNDNRVHPESLLRGPSVAR